MLAEPVDDLRGWRDSVNFAGPGEEHELRARAAHGGNDERMRAIMRRYDA